MYSDTSIGVILLGTFGICLYLFYSAYRRYLTGTRVLRAFPAPPFDGRWDVYLKARRPVLLPCLAMVGVFLLFAIALDIVGSMVP